MDKLPNEVLKALADLHTQLVLCNRINFCSESLYNVEQALIRNATAQPVSDGWVKCSDRMPEDAQWCLVYTDYGQFAQCWSSNTNRGWLGDEISIPNIDVTHWMPLPAAPGGQD